MVEAKATPHKTIDIHAEGALATAFVLGGAILIAYSVGTLTHELLKKAYRKP